MSVEISNWKEFRVGDLFDIHPTKTIEGVNAEMCNGGKTPLVVNQSYNNGVAGMCNFEPTERGGIITFSDTWEGNTFFYQPEDFIGFAHVQGMYPKQYITPKCMLFLCTMLDFDARGRFSYGRKKRRDIIAEVRLKLPADNEDNPDWEFMENYIKSLHHKPLTTKNKPKHTFELNVSEWKTFHVQRTKQQSGLFEIENCKCGSAGELEDGNDINYIGAKKSYNGVMRSVTIDKNLVSRGRGIMFICDGEGSVGYTNYMDEDFIGSTTTSIGYDEALTEKNAMFLVTVLDNEKFKYSYGRKYRAHLIDAVINLPIKHNSDGSVFIDKTYKYSEEGYVPDWEFMENYIKSLPYGDRLNG